MTEIQTASETPPAEPIRPLGAFSDFICNDLGSYNDEIHQGTRSPSDLFRKLEDLMGEIPDSTFSDVASNDFPRRIAMVDLAFALRSLDVAYNSDPEFEGRKNRSALFRRASELAAVGGRPPFLVWSDTAMNYPVGDPRTFMPPGRAKDQEVQLYTANWESDEAFKSVLTADYGNLTQEEIDRLAQQMRAATLSLVSLIRERDPGHFLRLDPFLGAKDANGVIVASGSFSAWTFLAGWFLTGRETFKERLLNPANRPYFDQASHPFIEAISEGSFRTLDQVFDNLSLNDAEKEKLKGQLRKEYDEFSHVHLGAVKVHAPQELPSPSPSFPSMTNAQTIRASLKK